MLFRSIAVTEAEASTCGAQWACKGSCAGPDDERDGIEASAFIDASGFFDLRFSKNFSAADKAKRDILRHKRSGNSASSRVSKPDFVVPHGMC